MRRRTFSKVAVFVILCLLSWSTGGATSFKDDTRKPDKQTTKTVRGTVGSANDTGKAILIQPKVGADVTLKVNDRTRYYLDGKKASYADVKVGLAATATYRVDGGDNWAVRVTLKTALITAGGTSTDCPGKGTCPCVAGGCRKECCHG